MDQDHIVEQLMEVTLELQEIFFLASEEYQSEQTWTEGRRYHLGIMVGALYAFDRLEELLEALEYISLEEHKG